MYGDYFERLEADFGEAHVGCKDGGPQLHNIATTMLWARAYELYQSAAEEERFLSHYEDCAHVRVDYPIQGHLVTDFIAAPHGDVVYVWDLWPISHEYLEGLSVLGWLDPRAPDLATRHNARPVPGPAIRPMTQYFPRSTNGLFGYWMSIFTAEDAAPYLPAGVPTPRSEPGLVYYQHYFELSEPPFVVDHFWPAAIEVSGPGIHPAADASTRGSLFPAPVRVSGPGVLPDPAEFS